MRTNPTQTTLYRPQTSFKSCSRYYLSSVSSNFTRYSQQNIYTTTRILREHINWNEFVDYFIENFKDKPKVNIYSLGCSDGSEPYSYAIAIISKLEKTQIGKFFPILASDIDSEVIEAANSGRINLDQDDFTAIENFIQANKYNPNNLDKSSFFKKIGDPLKIKNDKHAEPEYHSIYNPLNSYAPIGNLKNSVKFYCSDILTEVNKINDEGNTIINASHVLGYCSNIYIDNVLNSLSRKLKPGSIFVYDNFFNTPEFKNKLKALGFFFPKANMCFAQKLI